jgi:hypothetical protein
MQREIRKLQLDPKTELTSLKYRRMRRKSFHRSPFVKHLLPEETSLIWPNFLIAAVPNSAL